MSCLWSLKIEENTRLLATKSEAVRALQRQISKDPRAAKQVMLSWTQQTIGTTTKY